MRRIHALLVAAEELTDLNVFTVVLAEQPDGGGQRLEVQLALSFDEQDASQGMDTYCLSTEEGRTFYGGVLGWSVDDSRLELRLTAEAAGALGVENGFLVDIPQGKLELLREGLKRVLG
jgi:hypothetical protein